MDTEMNSIRSSQPLAAENKTLMHYLQGSGIVMLGTFSKAGMVFATEVMAARILLPERYGLITWGLLLINLISTLTGFGLNTAVRRFLPLYRAQNDPGSVRGTVVLSILLSATGGVIGGLLLFFGAGWLATSVMGDERERIILLTFVFALPLLSLQRNMFSVFGGFQLPRYKVLLEDLLVPGGFLIVVVSAWAMDWKEVHIARGYVLVFLLSTVLSLIFALRRTPYKQIRKVRPKYRVREILEFSWPCIFTEVLVKTTGIIDILLIGALTTAYDVGIYRTASNPASLMYFSLGCLGFLYLPIVTEYIGRGNTAQWKDLNARVARWSMLVNFPLFATLFFFPNEVVHTVYGPAYPEAALVLRILAAAYFGHVMVGLTGTNLVAAGMTKVQLGAHLVGLAINIGGNLLLIPLYGVQGAAVTTLLSIWTVNGICLIVMRRCLDLNPFTRLYLQTLGILLLVGFVGSFFLRFGDLLPASILVVLFPILCFGFMVVLYCWGYLTDGTDKDIIRSTIGAQIARLRATN